MRAKDFPGGGTERNARSPEGTWWPWKLRTSGSSWRKGFRGSRQAATTSGTSVCTEMRAQGSGPGWAENRWPYRSGSPASRSGNRGLFNNIDGKMYWAFICEVTKTSEYKTVGNWLRNSCTSCAKSPSTMLLTRYWPVTHYEDFSCKAYTRPVSAYSRENLRTGENWQHWEVYVAFIKALLQTGGSEPQSTPCNRRSNFLPWFLSSGAWPSAICVMRENPR